MATVDCKGEQLNRGDIVKIELKDKHSIYAIYSGENMLSLRTPEGSYCDTIENATNGKAFFKDNAMDVYFQPQAADIIIARVNESPVMTSDDGGLLFFNLCRYAGNTIKPIPSAPLSNGISPSKPYAAECAEAKDGYKAQMQGYQPPAPGYQPPAPGFGQPAPGYGPPAPGYGPPAPGYRPPAPGYQPQAQGQKSQELKITDSRGKQLTAGDVIVFDSGEFKHWGIYVGDGDLVHFTLDGVKKENIRLVANGISFSIDKSLDRRPPASMIVATSNSRVGQRAAYDPSTNNCESFVNQIVCSLIRSKQADKFLKKNAPKKSLFSFNKSSSATASIAQNGEIHTHATGSGVAVAQSDGKVEITGPHGSTFSGCVLKNGDIPPGLFCDICHRSRNLKMKI